MDNLNEKALYCPPNYPLSDNLSTKDATIVPLMTFSSQNGAWERDDCAKTVAEELLSKTRRCVVVRPPSSSFFLDTKQ